MKNFCLLVFSFAGWTLSAQIVNAYAKVTSVTGSNVLALSNVNITNHSFNVGEQVIVMQMQDDVIGTNTTNASSFGNLFSIANAGRYEVRTISAVSPTSGAPTSLTLTTTLANTYNTGAHSSVQLISFRNLGSNFTTTGNISGLAWDGNVGGVIAFYTSGTLTLNHQVSADGLGFSGGAASANAGGDLACVNSSYISALTTLGRKGQGIYKPTVADFSIARGKILNGGGGGSENNAGGGGGGNYTSGGDGGLGYPCNTGNSGRGLGGISLSTHIGASRIFMGGGGGGGQANNGVATAGGNGGGIILIKANTIASSTSCGGGIVLSANGITALNSGGDGAGGGGAGGSIVIDAAVFAANAACPLIIRANAGNGGTVGNGAAHGGGGGGGQGAVIYSSAQPAVNVTTQTSNGSAGGDDNVGTVNAGPGGGTSGAGILASSTGPLPVELIDFTAAAQNTKVLLSWSTATEHNNDYFTVERSSNGSEYTELAKVKGAGTARYYNTYKAVDNHPLEGINYYRLKQTDFDGTSKYAPVISFHSASTPDFSFFPNPVKQGESISIRVNRNSRIKTLRIQLTDLTGKEFFSENISTGQENAADFAIKHPDLQPGIYLIRLQSGSVSQVRKLVVQ